MSMKTAQEARKAADVKVGDGIWVLNRDNDEIIDGLVQSCDDDGFIAIGSNRLVFSRYPEQFGITWGFPEDRPDTPKAPTPITHTSPIEEKPAPSQADEDRAILARKGAQWVRANRPDIWRRLKADLMERTRREGDKLAKPGILAGKTASPWG